MFKNEAGRREQLPQLARMTESAALSDHGSMEACHEHVCCMTWAGVASECLAGHVCCSPAVALRCQ